MKPRLYILHEPHHDWQSGLGGERPLTEGFALATEDGVVGESWLVNFDTNYHIDLLLNVPLGDESVDRTETFHIYVGIYTTLGVHDEITKQVSLDDRYVELSVKIDKIWSVDTVSAVVEFEVIVRVIVGQNLVPIPGILCRPGLR